MKVLQTERLILRWFSADDAEFILELVNDPSWINNIGNRGLRTVDEAKAWIEGRLIGNYRRQGMGFWAVERREDQALMGLCGLVHRESLPTVDVGYALLPRFWGQGYAKEAAKACLDYGQRVLGLDRILAITAPHNERSARLLRSIGMRLEEIKTLPGEERETHVYAWGRAADAPRDEDGPQPIDALTQRFFAAFTNRDGACPTVAALPYFFLPQAPISCGTKQGIKTWDLWGFITPRAQLLESGRLTGFAEFEVEGRTEVFGQVAQRWIRYQKAGTLDGQLFEGEGRKSMQLVKTEHGWKIAALAWEDLP